MISKEELSRQRRENASKAMTKRYNELNKDMITPIFYPGQRVVCINDDFSRLLSKNPTINTPIKEEVYTIRKNLQFIHDVGVLLEEIHNECILGSKIEPNFNQSRFVLVSEVNSLQLVEEQLEVI